MYYIVGLGNPGEKYERTRHNVGWQALDICLQAWGIPSLLLDNKMSGRVTEGPLGESYVKVLYPDTFMNNSGAAVVKFVPAKETAQLVVVHDDVDLPLGEIKVTKGRGGGGNNGVQSVIQKLGTKDFVRVRIGVAPKSLFTGATKRPSGGGPLERFVLKPFGILEQRQLPDVYERTKQALEIIVQEGVEVAMNKCN